MAICVFAAVLLSFFTVVLSKDVLLPPSIVWNNDKHYAVFSKVDLRCETNETNIIWLKNGVELKVYDKTLTISDHGEGFYQCRVTNELGKALSDSSYVNIYQWQPGSDNKFVEGDIHGVASIPCLDGGHKYSEGITWEKEAKEGGKSVWKVVPPSLTTYIGGDGALTFTYVTKEDAGKYRCHVKYSGNTQTITTVATFTVTDDIVSSSFELYKSSKSPMVGLVGEDATFECHFRGENSYRVTWTINGKSLVDNQISNAKSPTLLTIKKVDKDHEGEIKCVAESRNGGQKQEATVQFEVKSYPRAPKDKKLISDAYGEIGSSVQFVCDASSDPEGNIQWYKNGDVLDTENLDKNMGLSDGNKVLKISDLKKVDTAVYQCNVSNIYGYVYDNAFLKIFDTTKFTLKPTDQEGDASNVTFRCKGETDPETKLTYKWLFNGEKFSHGSLNVNEEKLVIDVPYFKKAGRNVYGKWTCQISNGYFTKEADAHLKEIYVEAFPNWWILLVVLLILLLLIIILSCLCHTLYKNRGSDYPVDEIEYKNGNDPEKELLEIGFHDYQRDVGISNSGTMRSQRSMGSTNSLPRA